MHLFANRVMPHVRFADIFAQSVPRFNNPVNLKRLIAMIDEEDWSAMDAAFEGLLEKAASEGKKGAGQQLPAAQALRSGFASSRRALARIANTPRPLIQTICHVMKPDPRSQPEFTICDPACGTGGFLVCAWEWLVSKPVSGGVFDRSDYFIRKKVYHGQDLVPRPRRCSLARQGERQ